MGENEGVTVGLLLAAAIACGAAGHAVGRRKGRWAGGLLGILLGLFGLGFAWLLRSRRDEPPPDVPAYRRPDVVLSVLAVVLTFAASAYVA